jgi:DNA polymerase-3 subunit epsilon
MILLGFDTETTGLDKQRDRIIEMGLVLYSTGQHKILDSQGFLVQSDGVAVSSEITKITGVTQSAVDRFGYPVETAVEMFMEFVDQADAIIGHNSNWFDIPIIEGMLDRANINFPKKLAADTMVDIPGVKGEQLITMCAKKGFVMPFQHSAEDDAKAVLKLTSIYDMESPDTSYEKIMERAASPLVVLQSHQRRDQNDIVRPFGFRWNDPLKGWYRIAKEMDIPKLEKEAKFDFSRCDKGVMPVWK